MKVSVLVPVYGVERYIGKCAKTLFEQTYQDLEFIFVDDCTPDNSIQVIQEVLAAYPQRKTQVKIIRHDHNRGLGAARKTALEAALGEFVINVDSDDYLTTDAIEKFVAQQKLTGADIVSSAYNSCFENGTIVYRADAHHKKETYIKLMLIQHTILPHIWARLIRKSLYTENNICSVEGINMAEDLALTPRLIHAAKTIAYIDDATYYYRDDSSASTFSCLTTKHIVSALRANEELWSYFQQHDQENNYLFAIETGFLNTYQQSLKGELTTDEIKTYFSYSPKSVFFRCLHTLIAHRQTLPLLRFTYLAIKWTYRNYLRIKARHSSNDLT